MRQDSVERQFAVALASVIDEVKTDRSILAAVLCGSLSHDTVWEKSDIDLVLVTVDDRQIAAGEKALYADGVNIHAMLMPRAEFRKTVEGAVRNSFAHSFLSKGRLLYTHDPTIADLSAALARIGERDTERQLLRSAMHVLPSMYKARKWLLTRGDLEYTALWILYAATPLARVEVIGRRLLADREVIPQALTLNPTLFKTIYTDLLNTKKTKKGVQAALEAVERYMATRAQTLFASVIEYLRDAGDARSSSEIEDHFRRNFAIEGVVIACEYLADQGIIGKASTPVHLTKKSNVDVQELAFFDLGAR
jgi:predicted nucleotidyltransferase